VRHGSNASYSTATGVTIFGDGSFAVAGTFRGSVTFNPGAADEETVTGNRAVFVARYEGDGDLLWLARAASSHGMEGRGISGYSDGSCAVTGTYSRAARFGQGETNETTVVAVNNTSDIFLARLNDDGTLRWAVSAGGGTSTDEGNAVAAYPDASTVVTGWFFGAATFGAGESAETTLTAPSPSTRDAFVARYDTNGALVWARRAGGINDVEGLGVARAPAGGTYVTGYFRNVAVFGPGEAGETTLTPHVSLGARHIFVARYAANGNLVWARQAGGEHWDTGFAVTAGAAGRCLVTGYIHCDVGSKQRGAAWAKQRLDPSWSDLIDRAWDTRPDPATSVRQPADPVDYARTLELLALILERCRAFRPA
jgi:hypothetical protein